MSFTFLFYHFITCPVHVQNTFFSLFSSQIEIHDPPFLLFFQQDPLPFEDDAVVEQLEFLYIFLSSLLLLSQCSTPLLMFMYPFLSFTVHLTFAPFLFLCH